VKAGAAGACGTLLPRAAKRRKPRKQVIPITKINRPLLKTRFGDVLTGIKTGVSGKLTLGGVAYTSTSLAAVFSEALTAMGQADQLHTEWLAQVAVANVAIAKAEAVYGQFRGNLIAQTDEATLPKVLGTYGMSAPKARNVTVAVKAGAAVKAQATRKLRGTTGSKKKQSVKSDVQVSITAEAPATAPAAATPTTPGKS
jgi:hypothetical protein